MGRKKLEQVERIENNEKRNLTYCKRKKGLLKKAMELSKLCEQDIYLVIYDKEKQKLTEYCSTTNINAKICEVITTKFAQDFNQFQKYTNDDYQNLVENKRFNANDFRNRGQSVEENLGLNSLLAEVKHNESQRDLLTNIFDKIRVTTDDVDSINGHVHSADVTPSTRTNEKKKSLSKRRAAKHNTKSVSNKKILRDLISNDSSSCMSQFNDGSVSGIMDHPKAIREDDNESNSLQYDLSCNEKKEKNYLAQQYRETQNNTE